MFQTITRYIRHGPQGITDSIPRFMLAAWLWWRTWLTLGVLAGSLILLFGMSLEGIPPRFWGYIVGVLTVSILNGIDDRAIKNL